MRRLGLVLVGLGAFFIVTAALVKFYAYPKLAVAPKNQDSVTTLLGPDATLFDTGSLQEITTDIVTKVRTVGSVEEADKQGGNVVVWYSKSSTKSADGVVRSRDTDKVAFDATSGEAVNCCGEYVESDEGQPQEIKHSGLLVKFPFNTQKETYDWWDGNINKALPIDFVSEEQVEGLTTYKFEQTIAPTESGTIEVPLSLLGEDGEDNVTAQRMYSNIRTLWVEPNTGVIIKRVEQQNNTIAYNGEDKITTTKVTTGYDDATIQANADKYGPLGNALKLARTTVPLLLLILGLLALAGGTLLSRRHAADDS